MVIPWESVRVKLGKCGRVRWTAGFVTDPSWRAPGSTHLWKTDDNDFVYIWAGKGSLITPEATIPLHPGVCLWLRPGREYDMVQRPNAPLGMNYQHFDLLDADGQSITHRVALPPEVLYPLDAALTETITKRVVELIWMADIQQFTPHLPAPVSTQYSCAISCLIPTPGTLLLQAAEALLTGLLIELTQTSAATQALSARQTIHRYRQLVTRIATRMLEDPADAPSIMALATEAGYTRDHFTRIFKTVIGQSPQAFLIDARTARARQLLETTSLPLKQIAAVLGYDDVAFFSRQFKKRTGFTPMAYRVSTEKVSSPDEEANV